MDQSGGLFSFDADRWQYKPGERGLRIANAIEENPEIRPLLLPAGDGQSAYQIACPGKGTHLLFRHVKVEESRVDVPATLGGAVGCAAAVFAEGREVRVLADKRVPLPSPMQGTPAIVGSVLVVPLADGSLAPLSLPLAGAAAASDEMTWRSEEAGPETRGHVVALTPERFLCTNGARGFKVFKKNEKGHWESIPPEVEGPGLELDNRIVSSPMLLAAKIGASEVCVADAGGVVWVLEVQADGRLKVSRKWDLKGKITTGPFLRLVGGAARVGCVVDQRRLVWLDPSADAPLWIYETSGKAILEQPQMVEDILVITDQSGRINGLNAATGKPQGLGYALRGSIAPATSPVGFDANRLFVPLSDGTIMLLPLEYFQKGK
jgi:hypothetical protein